MKQIHLQNSWIIKAPLEDVFKIITDFEKMPKLFQKKVLFLIIKVRSLAHQDMKNFYWKMLRVARK